MNSPTTSNNSNRDGTGMPTLPMPMPRCCTFLINTLAKNEGLEIQPYKIDLRRNEKKMQNENSRRNEKKMQNEK